MERAIDNELEDLKRQILTMGGHVEQALTAVTAALSARQADRFDQVHSVEKRINEEHIEVDEACLRMLAKNSPVARDLRMVLSVLKISTDLERMGDQCVNIAHNGREYLARRPLAKAATITRMGEVVGHMVKGSLDCFVRGDVEGSKKILLMDDEVDQLKNDMLRELAAHMKTHSEDVESALDLILIARNLERLGDHATNIAEDVIFAQTGKDIRHGGHL